MRAANSLPTRNRNPAREYFVALATCLEALISMEISCAKTIRKWLKLSGLFSAQNKTGLSTPRESPVAR